MKAKEIGLYEFDGEYIVSAYIPDAIDPDLLFWMGRVFKKFSPHRYIAASSYFVQFSKFNEYQKQETIVNPKMETGGVGDDDFLLGQPNTIEDAVDTYLSFYSTAEDFDKIEKISEDEWTTLAHFVSGMNIRNTWYLWWQENHINKTWPKSMPPLVKNFHDLGIYHPDDMSSIILTCAYRKHNGKQLNIQELVDHFKNYWRSEGYPDGIFNPKGKL